jgi:hypothetical protein
VPNVFNPLSFFRHVPNASLERFFTSVPEFAGFDWGAVSERRVDSILERCHMIAPVECARIFRIFRTVESLANPTGTQVLIEAARDIGLDIAETISARQNAYDRALWCYMEDKRIVEGARTLAHIENLPKRSWETLKNLPVRTVGVTPEMQVELGRQLSEFFWTTQGRGDKCKVEFRRRDGDVDCFFAYPADYIDERFGYDQDGEFEFRSWNPAFEVVFGYHRDNGTIDIYAQGGGRFASACRESSHVSSSVWRSFPRHTNRIASIWKSSRTRTSRFRRTQPTTSPRSGYWRCGSSSMGAAAGESRSRLTEGRRRDLFTR